MAIPGQAIPSALRHFSPAATPKIKNKNIQIVNFQIQKKIKNKITDIICKNNYDELNKDNKRLGDRGELIVLQSEIDKLNKLGMNHFVSKVQHKAKMDSNAGYDILSFNKHGEEMHIEVKSTKGKQGDINFYLTDNELQHSKEDNNYWVYIVFEVNTANPKIWKIDNPFVNNINEIKLEPLLYRVSINVQKAN